MADIPKVGTQMFRWHGAKTSDDNRVSLNRNPGDDSLVVEDGDDTTPHTFEVGRGYTKPDGQNLGIDKNIEQAGMDQDGDGFVTMHEFNSYFKYAQVQGWVTADDYEAAKNRFFQMDTSGGGMVSYDEYNSGGKGSFLLAGDRGTTTMTDPITGQQIQVGAAHGSGYNPDNTVGNKNFQALIKAGYSHSDALAIMKGAEVKGSQEAKILESVLSNPNTPVDPNADHSTVTGAPDWRTRPGKEGRVVGEHDPYQVLRSRGLSHQGATKILSLAYGGNKAAQNVVHAAAHTGHTPSITNGGGNWHEDVGLVNGDWDSTAGGYDPANSRPRTSRWAPLGGGAGVREGVTYHETGVSWDINGDGNRGWHTL